MSYEVVFAPTARREMSGVPERVIPAIIEFVYGDLAANPRRVGKPLERELAGSFSARRGSYRILYDIDDEEHRVSILRVAQRADVYRTS
ncbi:MAG: plasmid stabilization system [Rhodoglobus sp.]|nr:plasmid stabilization system [Rhodoglobus sp.]